MNNIGPQKRPVDVVYQGSNVSQYFLADLPLWANFSTEGDCRREKQIRFLNFATLSKSYGLSYEELVQFQLMLNRRLESFVAGQQLEALRPKDEAYIFYNVQDQIKGGAKEFLKAEFNESLIILVDEAINDIEKMNRLKKLMRSSIINEAVPYLVSACMTKTEMEDFVAEKLRKMEGVKIISAEMFSPFDSLFKLRNGYYIDLKMLFSDNQKMTLYSYGDRPKNILGDFKYKQMK